MFQDPLTAVMAMLLLCFMGILVMFLFLIRSLASQAAEMREAFRKQQMSLADIERQLMDLSFALRKRQGGETGAEPGQAEQGGDSLTSMGQADLMSLLKAASQQKGGTLRFDDQLVPPTPASRPIAEEYDPSTDPHLFEDSLLPEADYTSYRSRAGRAGTGAVGRRGTPLSIKLDD